MTQIRFSLPSDQRVELAVYDLRGQKVATLVSDALRAGRHEVTWLGRDDSGRQVGSGTYVYRLTADGRTLDQQDAAAQVAAASFTARPRPRDGGRADRRQGPILG